MVSKVYKGRFPTLGDLKSYHPVGEPGWFAKVGWVDHFFVNGDWIESDGTVVGSGGTLSDADKAEIAKIAALDTAIKKDGGELVAGESIAQGANRTYTIGDVIFDLENRVAGTRTVANPIDATELDKWMILGQFPPTSFNFPPTSLIPKGYRLKRADGSILVNKATRVTPAVLDITKWSIENPGTGVIDEWIKNAGDDHAAGEKLFKADDRRIEVAGVGVRMTYRGADIDSCPAMSLAEIANWEYVSQAITPTVYPASALAPKGFRYRRNESSQLLQLKANTLLPATYDAAQWEAVSGANIRVLNGTNFDILTALSIVETEGVFDRVPQLTNGPNNAAQNVSGYWRVIGDSKNGLIMLTISDGTNIDKLAGDWDLRVSTDAQNVTTIGSWRKLLPSGNYKNSANNLAIFTPDKIYWNLAHNLTVSFVGDGPISLLPIGDWSERTGNITATGAATVFGQFPLSGSDEIELHYDPATLRFNIREASSSNRAPTVHNFGLTANVALKGATHHMAQVHVEAGKDYTIAAADWADGQWFRLVQTAGTNTTEKLLPSGFAGAYLRDGSSRDISGGILIGRQDTKMEVTITNNNGQKYLNIDDKSTDAHAISGYANPPAGITAQMLVNVNGATIAKANAIAPNALAATHYIDMISGALTPLYADGCIFTLPAAVAGASAGQDLFLGANGAFSTTAPASASGNIRQPVAVVRINGKGVIKLREAGGYQV